MFDHILVPLDASLLAECAVPHAAALTRIADGRVTVLRVLEPPESTPYGLPSDPVARDVHRDETRRYLDGIVERLAGAGVRASARVLDGTPATALIGYGRAHEVDLIVLSSHGRSGQVGSNLGAVGRKLLEHAHVHLLLVRAFAGSGDRDAPLRYRRLLLPLDGSQRAECAVPVACRIADAHGARILLAHVVRRPEMVRQAPLSSEESALTERVAELNRQHAESYLSHLRDDLAHAGRDVALRIVDGAAPAEALQALVGETGVDLLIVSAHGAGSGTRQPFGGITTDLLVYGDVATLVVQDREAHELEASAAERAAGEHAGHG